MNPILRNVLAVIAGIVLGGFLNSTLIDVGPRIIPNPSEIIPGDMESLMEFGYLLKAKHCVFPFLAHALGTLLGAFIAAKFAATRNKTMALIIGWFFLFGGIVVNYLIPGPTWFKIVDLLFAYIPMAYLGWILAGRKA